MRTELRNVGRNFVEAMAMIIQPRAVMAALSLVFPFTPKSPLPHPPPRPSSPSLYSSRPCFIHFQFPKHGLLLPLPTRKPRRLPATSPEVLPAEITPPEIIPPDASEGVGSTVISGLFLLALVALSILTIGVIYIAVTDFLQKREREKYEEAEESANAKKKGGKKNKVRARAGPRGFGQKLEEDEG